MSRAKIETAYLGWQTVRILAAVPDTQAAWLIKALCAWILEDKEPSDIPPECIGSWVAIKDESNRIHAAMKESEDVRSEAGRIGAAARWKMRSDATACDRIQSHSIASKNDAIRCDSMRESESENENNSASLRDASIPRPPACEEEVACPMDPDRLRVIVTHIGMQESEVSAWSDYYTMRGWRADPRSTRPMTAAQAEASLRRWHTNEGIRAARQEHIDAKMDERHQQTLAARAANTASFVESEDAARRRKEQEAADLAKAKQLMNW